MRQASARLKVLGRQISETLRPVMGQQASPRPVLVALISLELVAEQAGFFFGEDPDAETLGSVEVWLPRIDQALAQFESAVVAC
jgi:hypothetical protein